MEPWFQPSTARNVYLSLLHLPDSSPSAKAVPDSVLRAALLRRAVTVLHRAIHVRSAKGPLQALLQRGSVGDDTWTQFTQAEKELDAELKEIMEEANSLTPPGMQPPWGQFIFQSAAEMAHNERFQKKVESFAEKGADTKQWWSERTSKIRSEFLKSEGVDVETTPGVSPNPAATEPFVPLATSTPAPATATVTDNTPPIVEERVSEKVISPAASSDEDVVVVEAVSTPPRPTPVTTGSMRSKKGKGKK